nr:hypothetical protein [Bradyrhizobium japonicum]
MRRVTFLALGLVFAGVWSHDSARGQTSVAPPVSLARPDASPPRAGAKNSRKHPAASSREASPPAIGGLPSAQTPATDYDGFSAGTVDDNDAASQVTPPAGSRTAKGLAGQSSFDEEDEALRRRLTICKNCK